MGKQNIADEITFVTQPMQTKGKGYYPTNREPLQRGHLVKLPLGSIKPKGWIKHQLDLMAEGYIGRLKELSQYLQPENGWLGGENPGWEEQPYWLRGFYSLAVLTENEKLIIEANEWIEAVIVSQQKDGYFGAVYHKKMIAQEGKEISDLWPHMAMLDVLVNYYEHTHDQRVIELMTRFFDYCIQLPDNLFIPEITLDVYENYIEEYGDWKPRVQHKRAGDFLPNIYWLYNQTGEERLLDFGARVYKKILRPMSEYLDNHNVHYTQRFRYPGNYYLQSGQPYHWEASEYWYQQHMAVWGQQPRGAFGGDEKIRSGHTDPKQAIETCGIVEFTKSFYILGRISGETKYADRCEDLLFNHFPATHTPDMKGLLYLTASNVPQLTDQAPGYHNKGAMFLYSATRHRCCLHNSSMGWPWYAQNLWQATADLGLAAWMYGSSEVEAKAGAEGKKVTLHQETDYPFKGSVKITLTSQEAVRFPLYLRVPKWCVTLSVEINGESIHVPSGQQGYVRIERQWHPGDEIKIDMGMEVSMARWPRNGSVTIDRGPLSYSVRIEEDWKRYHEADKVFWTTTEASEEWPDYEVYPKSPWNYGLILDKNTDSIEVKENENIADQPWTLNDAPITIKLKAKRIPGWKYDEAGLGELQPSPIISKEPIEEITMIPMGCARLRIACLPVIGEGRDAREWKIGSGE